MAFSVDQFRGMVQDLARGNLFRTQISMPVGSNPLIDVLVQTTSFPGRTVNVVDVPFQGQQNKFAGNVSWEDWSVTFRMDDPYLVYNNFILWQEMIRNSSTNVAALPSLYKRDQTLFHIGTDTIDKGTLVIYGAWPTSVGAVSFDTTQTGDVQTFDVTFAIDGAVYIPV